MSATAESHPIRSAYVGSASHGSRKPGVWAPWPGATMTSMVELCPPGGLASAFGAHEESRPELVGTLQSRVGLDAAVGEPAENQRDPEGEGVPSVAGGEPGEVHDPLQPVSHGVRVDEQDPGGAFDGASL